MGIVYHEKRRHPLRWVLGIAVFVMALTFTVDEVFGLWLPKGDNPGATQPQREFDGYSGSGDEKSLPVTVVPEPGTILLIGSGLAAMHVLRKRKKA